MFNLGVALLARFAHIGAAGDLDEAMAATLQAAAGTGTDHPQWTLVLSNLGLLLRIRSQRNGELADLDAAIDLQREVVNLLPSAGKLVNLGKSLCLRFARTGMPGDLDEAVDLCRRGVHATPADHPERAHRLSGLGNALVDRFGQTGELADLDESVDVCRRAVEATAAGHPDRAVLLTDFAAVSARRFGQTARPGDFEQARRAAAEAVRDSSASPTQRIEAVRVASNLAAQGNDPAAAADLLATAVQLLPELAARRLRRPDQQYRLARIAGLAAYAAAAALDDPRTPVRSRAERALGLVEAGRAVLLSQGLEIRADLTELRAARPDLAARFADLRRRLDQETSQTVHTDPVAGRTRSTTELYLALPDNTNTSDTAERVRLTGELAATLRDIRAVDGFATFGLPPTTRELLAEAVHGPVVTFVVAGNRCVAVILTADRVTSLELPGVTEQALTDRVRAFHDALPAAVSRDLNAVEHGPDARDVLTSVLEWLWDNVVGPVLDQLGFHRTPSGHITGWPRVWWAPAGRLGLLPLHAAGYHDDPDTPARRTAIDRVVSSYTPTIRALRHARRSPAIGRSPDSSLIVAMPTTPGLAGDGQLPHVRVEAEILRTLLPNAHTLDTPTARRVLDELPGHAIAHFACHGVHDPDPAASRLLLHDHAETPLTVAHLAPVDLERAQLAYLSACNTALSKDNLLLDEAIQLASGFQLAGFPHVIGTLWAIDDRFAVQVAARFYRALRDPGTGRLDVRRAAYAMHETTRSLRDRVPGAPSLWAAHLHSGV
ncbi:CHAT domain-containing protein [Actinophytocola sediminis]